MSKGQKTAHRRTQTQDISQKLETEGPVFGYKTDIVYRRI